MINSFFYGILSVAGATIFQQIILIVLEVEFIDTSYLSPLLIFGAISEEIFKFIFVYKLKTQTQNFKEIFFGSMLIGFGFSLVELTFKVWGDWKNLNYFLENYTGIILIHVLTAGIMGMLLTQKWPLAIRIFSGLSLAIILHLAYNALKIYIF